MAIFEPNKPIITREPAVKVDEGLRPGRYRFQLVVEDDEGNRSLPDTKIVIVV